MLLSSLLRIVAFVQELRVKKYPDFMCKKDRDTYESKKVWLGRVR